MSIGRRYGGDRFTITKNQHTPNRYSKAYLIEDDIRKLSGRDSPWVTSYHVFSLTTAATSWPKGTKKPQPSHDKQIQKYLLPLQKIAYDESKGETKMQVAAEFSMGLLRWRIIVKAVRLYSFFVDTFDHSILILNCHF